MIIICRKKLWLTADRDTLVPDGDPLSALLFCIPGKKIHVKDLARIDNAAEFFPEVTPDTVGAAPSEPGEETGGAASGQTRKGKR